MGSFKKTVRGVIITVWLFMILLFCNALQMYSFLILPIFVQTRLRFNRELAGFWWGLVASTMERRLEIKIEVVGDALPMNENAILLPNHQSTADIPPLLWLAWKHGMADNIKWFVKDPIKWIPGVGWGLWLLGTPFVKREWKEDKAPVIELLDKYRENKIPIWMISFLESTRATKQKLVADAIRTIEMELKPLNHHLFPRPSGIVATVQGLRTHVSAIYDVEILYHDFTPGLWDLVSGKVAKITIHINRIPIEDVPAGDDEIYSFVKDIFYHKDKLYEEFYK